MTYILPPLPYTKNALEPYISEETLQFHYEKHHRNYLNKLNELMTQDNIPSLEHLIQSSEGTLFNQAAQTWNHTFYWNCMSAQHHQSPQGKLLQAMTAEFDSFDNLKLQMKQSALGQFASGWTWLVLDTTSKLQIMSTSNADSPLRGQHIPLLVIDVWEHAYYIDTRNNRALYLDNFWNVTNWAFVEQNYQNALIQLNK